MGSKSRNRGREKYREERKFQKGRSETTWEGRMSQRRKISLFR
jgi:hypothetical protein